jgi:hypothetical protein
MIENNQCFTCFMIRGNFDPQDITTILELLPSKQWRIGDTKKNGTRHGFSLWEHGHCSDYDVFVENQMMCTIEKLMPKIQELKEIKQKQPATLLLLKGLAIGNWLLNFKGEFGKIFVVFSWGLIR